MNDKEVCRVYFSYEDVEGNVLTKNIKMPWDANWHQILNEVCMALEGAGFIDVRKRIMVKDIPNFNDPEAPEYVPLMEAIEPYTW